MRAAALFAFLLAACAAPGIQHEAAPPLPGQPEGLLLSGSEGFEAAPNTAYEASAILTFKREGAFLKLLSQEEPSPASALEEMRSQSEILARFFERQTDPYYGQTREASACVNRQEFSSSPAESETMLLKRLHYQAGEKFQATPCESHDYFYEVESVMLYCKERRKLFTLRYFYPKSAKPSRLPAPACR